MKSAVAKPCAVVTQKGFPHDKIDGQTNKAATQQLDETLRLLQTDHLDLLQFHELIRRLRSRSNLQRGGQYEGTVCGQRTREDPYVGFTGVRVFI
jgi:aryl-alcohol dehydrogenase-like predicted oxidoreductase